MSYEGGKFPVAEISGKLFDSGNEYVANDIKV